MKDFNGIRFDGTFRSYQQGVLDRASTYFKDKKIHIVAAPGSGKTILGVELIRRLNSPALILSPSVTIRQQWGERFCEKFLPSGAGAEDYVSFDLKEPKLLTSVTYQALHAAVTGQTLKAEVDSELLEPDAEQEEDFSDFNIFDLLKQYGIKTVCLDEAHHLKSEWQKALEIFISQVQKEVMVISLTATPPYDSTISEWNRYVSLCGEIDEEIFVPQLVAQKTLCPHQDFIHFSYPTAQEAELARDYRIKGTKCAEEIIKGPFMSQILAAGGILEDYERHESFILEHVKGCRALLVCARYGDIPIPRRLVRLVAPSGELPRYDIFAAQEAFDFVINTPEQFSKDVSENLRAYIAQNGLIDKKRVSLVSNEKINKRLASSTGKLKSINDIVAAESRNLGDKLRLLILTDYIKRDLLKIVGTQEELTAMGTVPVFESIRRSCGGIRLAMLSGSLVIVPDASAGEICGIAKDMQVSGSLRHIADTEYSELVLSGSNKNKVAVITEAFRRGLIQVLVGTKSLLGEGWDSPCINSLILASFVGSFMLSNQMRGRAIRTDRDAPDKVSNIWHLVNVEPPAAGEGEAELLKKAFPDSSRICSDDFNTLERRFNCFLAPAYNTKTIESGIDRVDILTAPFDGEWIYGVNEQMLSLAADRQGTAARWFDTLGSEEFPEILDVVEVKNPALPKSYLIKTAALELVFAAVFCALLILRSELDSPSFFNSLLSFVCGLAATVCGVLILVGFFRLLLHRSPVANVHRLAKCVLKSLRKTGRIDSSSAKAYAAKKSPDSSDIYCMIAGASIHDKRIFSSAVSEMLSGIDNPRYVLVRKGLGKPDYKNSYACPATLGAKKEFTQAVLKALRPSAGSFVQFYTRGDSGRTHLLKCRKHSYINAAGSLVRAKKIAKL